ncbi:MAG: hypothetical protein ACHQK8_05750 [Bacteroidia bacterium]
MKKIPSYFFFLTVLFLLFQQCKKDSATNSNSPNTGYVKEYYTNKPIAYAQVGVYSDNNYSQLVENVYTDSTGKFITNENISNNQNILVTKSGYFQYTWDFWQTNRDFNKNIFHLDMPSQLLIHLKNTKPVSKYDWVELPDFNTTGITLEGNNIDTMLCCLFGLRYKLNTVYCWVVKGGPEYSNHVKITPMDALDTVNVFY